METTTILQTQSSTKLVGFSDFLEYLLSSWKYSSTNWNAEDGSTWVSFRHRILPGIVMLFCIKTGVCSVILQSGRKKCAEISETETRRIEMLGLDFPDYVKKLEIHGPL